MLQAFFLSILAFFARNIVRIHQPYIIGVTGTVGKTTITGHVRDFLISEFGSDSVMSSPYQYNGEYGLPLTIIGTKTGGKNPFLWIWIFGVACFRMMQKYPKYLVLEYGIDHPMEMDFLVNIAVPDIAIIAEVVPNHIEQFGTLEAYRNEKLKLAAVGKKLVIHSSLRQFIEQDALFYSGGAMSDIDASHIEISPKGTSAIVHAYDQDFSLSLSVFGSFQIENILPLYAIARILETNPSHIADYARGFIPEKGRSGILKGINNSIIIDGSYNGGYLSLRSGVISMRALATSHEIIFFLGDMRELGNDTEKIHKLLAEDIISILPHELKVSFFLVGPNMQKYVQPILAKYFPVEIGLSSRALGERIAQKIKKNNVKNTMIYVKGSQNTIFLEEGIKFFIDLGEDMARLCRQSDEWIRKKENFFSGLEKGNKS